MKTKFFSLVAALVFVPATFALAATNDLSGALQKGLFEEEANHNLEAAAQAYQSVAAQFDKDRKLAATAIFRLGEVYRKQGKTNEANAQYERILREFSDQTELVKLSQKFVSRTLVKSNPDQIRAIEQLLVSSQSEYQNKAAMLSRLRKLSIEELRGTLPIVDSDTYLSELLKKLGDAEIKLAVAKKEFAEDHPEVKKGQAIVDLLKLQMDERIDATLTALETQVTTSKARVEDLEKQLAEARRERSDRIQTSGTVEPARSVLSEEQQEIARIKAMIKDSPDLINALRGDALVAPLHSAASAG